MGLSLKFSWSGSNDHLINDMTALMYYALKGASVWCPRRKQQILVAILFSNLQQGVTDHHDPAIIKKIRVTLLHKGIIKKNEDILNLFMSSSSRWERASKLSTLLLPDNQWVNVCRWGEQIEAEGHTSVYRHSIECLHSIYKALFFLGPCLHEKKITPVHPSYSLNRHRFTYIFI